MNVLNFINISNSKFHNFKLKKNFIKTSNFFNVVKKKNILNN